MCIDTRRYRSWLLGFACTCLFNLFGYGQHELHHGDMPASNTVEAQPLLAQALRLNEALNYLGSSLSEQDQQELINLRHQVLTDATSMQVQKILDRYCLAVVDINAEARVKVKRGSAGAVLHQFGWTSFLVKVINQAGSTATLNVESRQALPMLHMSMYPFNPHPSKDKQLTPAQVADRFLEVQLFKSAPLQESLSGLGIEYVVLQVYCRDAGRREADLAFNIGQGTQDLGFRNSIAILFDSRKAVKVNLEIKDEAGAVPMASFIFSDGIERVIPDSIADVRGKGIDYRFTIAQVDTYEGWYEVKKNEVPARLRGIYPLPSRRMAATDEYPDFFFQPQVYRGSGEHIFLPPGKYQVEYGRGPEYNKGVAILLVPSDKDSITATFTLKRWINLKQLGYYSGDHHIHAAGCSHYESPEEGVRPYDMWRQIVGEDLGVGAVLAWGPGWYHQKEFFTGGTHPLSTTTNLMRYDVEVSGFPSSHAGHLVLLGLKEDDYPVTKHIEDWPGYTLPVLRWARRQGAITGYAHSGWGLQPKDEEDPSVHGKPHTQLRLPNYVMPKMDGIGANEYIAAVALGAVDLYSVGNTPAAWELNTWYHTLNAGFRTRISGETDFPCIYDERVGAARSYFKLNGPLTFEAYKKALIAGDSYVSDGRSHIIDFKVNGVKAENHNHEVRLAAGTPVTVTARVVALLDPSQDSTMAEIAHRPLDRQPYWTIERARVGNSRKIGVELIVNGSAVDTSYIEADGSWKNIQFKRRIDRSSWVALRVFPSSHTNPIFVLINDQPVGEPKSIQWCIDALNQCWKMKQVNIPAKDRGEALKDYDAARAVYIRKLNQRH